MKDRSFVKVEKMAESAGDINDGIFHNPFDEEVKQLGQGLVAILKPIIDTIDRFGLRQQYLNKHKENVARFFRDLSDQAFASEAAAQVSKAVAEVQGQIVRFLGS